MVAYTRQERRRTNAVMEDQDKFVADLMYEYAEAETSQDNWSFLR